MSSRAVSVFFSYSHKDEALRNELANHLNGLKLSGAISDWHDRKILPGDEWDRQIKDNLNSAQIILLLVSSDFIASRYCQDVEITRAMERHEAGEARVIPVILRKCFWHVMPFGKLQALPKNGTPVMDASTWPTLDDAFYNVVEGIYKAANSFAQPTTQSGSPVKSSNTRSVEPTASAPVETSMKNAQAQYRERVKEYLIDRKLTTFNEIRLSILQKQLKLAEAEAQRIVSEELAPIEQAKETYRDALSQLIEAGQNPADEEIRQDLVQIQQELELTEIEVTELEQPIFAAAEYKFEVFGSECGIDYTRLRDLLKAKEWQVADEETYKVMIQTAGKKVGSHFTQDDLLSFPRKDLLLIDRLWVKYSEGLFGFSIQKRIYAKCRATINRENKDNDIWIMFGDRVKWRAENKWVDHSETIYSTLAPEGHLPRISFQFQVSILATGLRSARGLKNSPKLKLSKLELFQQKEILWGVFFSLMETHITS